MIEAQLNYTTTKNALNWAFAFDKFRFYLVGTKIIVHSALVGTKFIVYTDHATIRYLMTYQESYLSFKKIFISIKCETWVFPNILSYAYHIEFGTCS